MNYRNEHLFALGKELQQKDAELKKLREENVSLRNDLQTLTRDAEWLEKMNAALERICIIEFGDGPVSDKVHYESLRIQAFNEAMYGEVGEWLDCYIDGIPDKVHSFCIEASGWDEKHCLPFPCSNPEIAIRSYGEEPDEPMDQEVEDDVPIQLETEITVLSPEEVDDEKDQEETLVANTKDAQTQFPTEEEIARLSSLDMNLSDHLVKSGFSIFEDNKIIDLIFNEIVLPVECPYLRGTRSFWERVSDELAKHTQFCRGYAVVMDHFRYYLLPALHTRRELNGPGHRDIAVELFKLFFEPEERQRHIFYYDRAKQPISANGQCSEEPPEITKKRVVKILKKLKTQKM